MCRFNLTGDELRATVLERWASEQWVELGERKWSPHQAKLTVLQGAPIPVAQLSMGRGWRAAQRQSRDVTAELLAAARHEAAARDETASGQEGSAARAADSTAESDLVADSLGLELLAEIGAERTPLRRAWELAQARNPGARASESLALAERAIASLLRARLIVLLAAGTSGEADSDTPLADDRAERMLRVLAGWAGESPAERVWIRRA
jgi:hypothetical protein